MQNLQRTRQEIDKIDSQISKLLQKRAEKSKLIAKIKKEKNTKIIDKNREKQILEKFDTEFEKAVFKKILIESRKIQREALTKK